MITVAAQAQVTWNASFDLATPRSILRCCTGGLSPAGLGQLPALCAARAAHTRPLLRFSLLRLIIKVFSKLSRANRLYQAFVLLYQFVFNCMISQ